MPDHDNDIRVSCAKRFATIDGSINSFEQALRQFQLTNERVVRTEESVRGLWKELREDVMPELKQVPRDVREALDQQRRDTATALDTHRRDMVEALDKHASDCPARTKAMRRATGQNGTTSDPPPTGRIELEPAPPVAQPRRSLLPVSPVAIRWLIYIGLIIGGAIAGLATAFGVELGLPDRAPAATATDHDGKPPAAPADARPARPAFPRLKPIGD